jgi:hypothetical protein
MNNAVNMGSDVTDAAAILLGMPGILPAKEPEVGQQGVPSAENNEGPTSPGSK